MKLFNKGIKACWGGIALALFWVLLISSPSSALPIIVNDEVSSLSDNQVVITWQTTNEAANSGLHFGISNPPSGLAVTDEGAANTQYHYVTLNNLFSNTVYYYKIFSSNSNGTTEGTLKSFRTLEKPSGNYLFSFAVLSDIHYGPNESNTTNIRGRPYNSSEAIVDALVSAINQYNPAFTIIKGDLLDAGVNNPTTRTTQLKAKLDNLTAAPGMYKYYPVPGNHDKAINYGASNWVSGNLGVLYPPGAGFDSTKDSVFNYSFTYNNYRFIMLDSSNSLGITAEANLVSLEAELVTAKANKQKAFIFMHHEVSEEADIPTPILAAICDVSTWQDSDWNQIRLTNKTAFFNLINNYVLDNGEPVVGGIFMGHIHDNRYRTFFNVPCVRTTSALQFGTGFIIYKVYSNGLVQSFYKLPAFSDNIARPLIIGTQEVTQAYAQQFYLGGGNSRNLALRYSAIETSITPTVETTEPPAGSINIPLNQPVILLFTKPISNHASVSDWLTILCDGVPVTLTSADWTWDLATTSLKITKTWTANKPYAVTVKSGTTGVKAIDNTYLPSDYAFSFTTGASATNIPPVASIFPLMNSDEQVTNITTDSTPTLPGIVTDESSSTVQNVEFRYKLDNAYQWGDWLVTDPDDGVFNSSQETFTLTFTAEACRGLYNLQLRSTNAAGIITSTNFPTYNFWIVGPRPEIIAKANGQYIINGDPINANASFEITTASEYLLTQLWFTLDGTRTNILPSPSSFVNSINYVAALNTGSHTIKIEAAELDNQGAPSFATKEVFSLMVQTSGDLTVIGQPLNYPNPFNAGTENTSISYSLSRPSDILLSIHDLAGNLLMKTTYLSGFDGGKAGYNEVLWDGKTASGSVVGNGIYIYLLIANGKVVAKGKITVLKR